MQLDLPVYYLDKKSTMDYENERLEVIQQRSNYSEKFLESITTKLEFDDIKPKYRIVDLDVEEQVNADSGFLKEPSKEEEPFYRQFFCQEMSDYILNKQSDIVLQAAIGPEGNNHSILFIEYYVVNLIFKLAIYRYLRFT